MADVVYKTLFQFKRGTKETWERLNPILKPGEPGFEKDTGFLKIGNGNATWTELDYYGTNDSSIISVNSFSELPSIGNGGNTLYKVTDERALYQWNGNTYELIGQGASGGSPQDIDFIVCGTSEDL